MRTACSDTIVALGMMAGLLGLGIGLSCYLSEEEEFVFYASKRRAFARRPAHPLYVGVLNYQTDRWIVASKVVGFPEEPKFFRLSAIEHWWSHFDADQRLKSLFSHLEKDYQRWKRLSTIERENVPSSFLRYSSLIASNCEAINTAGRTIRAFHGSEDDYLNSRVRCQNWLDLFIQWHPYFASDFNKSIPVVLVPDWQGGERVLYDSTPSTVIGGHLQSTVAYLFNANYNFRRRLESLYTGSDQELIVITDRPGYQLSRISWGGWSQYNAFLPDHRKMSWTEHVPCDPVTGGCRFKNFSGCAEQVTPYLLSHPETGRQILIFHHGETVVAWYLGVPWLSKNKVVSRRAKNNRFELNLTKAFDLETTSK
ncbi:MULTISPECIES: hypothetical protein [unclassified Endozoicomonas]|uniref:hypothetical protein n=1 Tax=unclassified Endozoicomonas TaxID=2644528 RepID=UPI002147AD68|nr:MULTISPECIES: hypothetical protein [unclassified Endozoicomonas]